MAVEDVLCEILLKSSCPPVDTQTLLIEYILIPSVLLIIFLTFAAKEFLRGTGLKLDFLLAIIFYIVIIYQGWYGIIANFGMWLIPLFLIIMAGYFFIGRWLLPHPKTIISTAKDIKGWYEKGKRELSREAQLEAKLDEIRSIVEKLQAKRGERDTLPLNDPERRRLGIEISTLQDDLAKTINEARKLIEKIYGTTQNREIQNRANQGDALASRIIITHDLLRNERMRLLD